MTLSLSLSPRAEAKLVERATAAGEDPAALAARLLERAIGDSLLPDLPPGRGTRFDDCGGRAPDAVAIASASVNEFDAALEELFGAEAGSLPDAASSYSRADIYFDHD